MNVINKDLIENTYAEAFDGFYTRLIVTADDSETLRRTAEDATATPSTVIGRLEGGIEKWLGEKKLQTNGKAQCYSFGEQ